LRTRIAYAALGFLIGSAFQPPAVHAGFRGAFDPLTVDSAVPNRYESAVFRPLPAADGLELFFSFTTRSPVTGREGSRQIWLHRNIARAGLIDLQDARQPLLMDPTGRISYLDPAWSPDGRFLAYVQTDPIGANMAIYVQEFQVSDDIFEAVTPVGNAILVVPSTPNASTRNPDWSPDGTSLVFESTMSGMSYDLYTVTVFPTVGSPVRRTFQDTLAEQNPAWSPDGTRIAYQTNIYGPPVIAIVDLTTPMPHQWTFAERDAAPISHAVPGWSGDGRSLYYHAPKGEDPSNLSDIWKLDLASQAKCAISIDLTSDSDVDVSRIPHRTAEGIDFNYILFTSMAGAPTFLGPNTWRGELIYNCYLPLSMGVKIKPDPLRIGGGGPTTVTATLNFPPETIAAGFQCSSTDGPNEGVRMRATVLPSPTLEGLLPLTDETTGGVIPIFNDKVQGGSRLIEISWDRAAVESLVTLRGLYGSHVPIRVDAYSNLLGRTFRGIAYIKVVPDASATTAATTVTLEQNAPNPFNPSTVIRFVTGGDGTVAVRIFNVRGELIRAFPERWLPRGSHSVAWDGRDDRGQDAASGIYYAQASSSSGSRDRITMTLMR
jgi:Tol biopolymer transport system component